MSSARMTVSLGIVARLDTFEKYAVSRNDSVGTSRTGEASGKVHYPTMAEVLASVHAQGRMGVTTVTPDMIRDNRPGVSKKRQFGKAPKKKRGK